MLNSLYKYDVCSANHYLCVKFIIVTVIWKI